MSREPIDPLQDPEFRAWARRVREGLLPGLTSSAFVMSLFPNDGVADVKFAVETGFAMMLDKPIVLVVKPGTRIPNKMVLVADDIVEADLSTDEGRSLGMAAIEAAMRRLEDNGTLT